MEVEEVQDTVPRRPECSHRDKVTLSGPAPTGGGPRYWLSNAGTGEQVWLEDGDWQLSLHGEYAYIFKYDGEAVVREWAKDKFI